MDRSSRQKISKAAEILNETIEQFDLTDAFRTLQPKKIQNTDSFQGHREHFSRIDHALGHKTNFNKFKRIEIISSIFSDFNGMKLEMNHRERNEENMTTWRLKNMLLKSMTQ